MEYPANHDNMDTYQKFYDHFIKQEEELAVME